MNERATIRDVARDAGVGISTVSKALNHGRGSPEVIARVAAAAERLGYRPSRQAASLRLGSTRTIGVLIPDLSNPVFVSYLRGVESVARSSGRTVQVADGQGNASETDVALRQLAHEQVDGVVLAGPVGRTARKLLRDRGIAVVPDGARDRAEVQAWADAEGAATRAMAERLLELGHRRFAWVVLASSSSQLAAFRAPRYDAFSLVVDHAAATVQLCVVPHDAETIAPATGLGQATAIICASQTVAPLVLRWLREQDRRLGRDVSVVTYGDSPWTLAVDPPLAVVRHDTTAEGARAAQALIERLEGRSPARPAAPSAEFVDRPSVGPAPAG